ncbi:putative toxin-antitoxin system toxin component, PIN family [Thermococcus waiotapuensis]|uniref:Toxin-antitoxin system toxin component, PIN family n=1 Tax=Thermococcus waiotapuensis TaxID=90909 RepID=A0AAE4T480_9EURY|nr:putative toxin-antitoxin system toxin component, PIN family [Thermococcus waiotapuensis]MDV3104496.1 putative toxin-antitoxin system toxin component, PIN family [Thermococcus waiotapuensis]
MGKAGEKAEKTRPGVVIDTSVLISALLSSKGHAFEVIKLLFDEKIKTYYSTATRGEYYNVIAYPKILKKIPRSIAKERVDVVILYSERVPIKRSFKRSKTLIEKVGDAKDIPFLDVVYNSKAEFLITYDRKHLLRIRDKNKRFKLGRHEFYILTPKEFLELYKKGKDLTGESKNEEAEV